MENFTLPVREYLAGFRISRNLWGLTFDIIISRHLRIKNIIEIALSTRGAICL
jgi:hypothetical protein